jgi:glycosyltransferase involved in cell wall biosynthesis
MTATSTADAPPRPAVDVLVASYQSAGTLDAALTAVRANVPVHCLIVVDRPGTDGSAEIARRHGARVISDDIGLGAARNRALAAADTDPVLFVDSDVRITGPEFYAAARHEFARPGTAAVVGMSVGHRFRYGLPLGLTLIGRTWSLRAGIPDGAQGRETYYLQRAAREQHLRVRYVPDAMVHAGTYRADPAWPEFQGASIRLASGWDPREVAYAAVVILLMHMNGRRARHVLYSPIFFAKLLRGFLAPRRWSRIDRAVTLVRPLAVGPRP